MKLLIATMILMLGVSSTSLANSKAEGAAPAVDRVELLINLTTDDLHSAAMAISFADQMLMQKNVPSTIFLNVKAVRLADTSIPEQSYGIGVSPRQMLQDFLNHGGQVLICTMCVEMVGGIESQYMLQGVGPSTIHVMHDLMMKPNLKIMSY